MRHARLALIAISVISGSGPVFACSCAQPNKSAAELADAGWKVARGIVMSENIPSGDVGLVTYKFKVSRAINAKFKDIITLESPASSAACGARLVPGAISVVLLSDKTSGGYGINLCGQLAIHHDVAGWNAILDDAQ